ncbi:unnamed protein product [Linum trigynum]|uniref:Dof zinc finger protein n=1 Tax=Linum trigynum TaxID=586398 RepID=A0AAV2GJF3_9ROSI
MPSESSEYQTAIEATQALPTPASAAMVGSADDAPSLPCPRCESTNTKFCYYNNYNLSQPRHFCKSCRRYWTQGGSLRNVPVGGGTRKSSAASSSKRPRASSAAAAAVTTTTTNMDSSASTNTTTSSSSNSANSMSSLTHEQQHDHYPDPPLHLGPDPALPVFNSAEEGRLDEFRNLKENQQPVSASENGIANVSGSFISLLNNQTAGGGLVGYQAGYGSGHGYGFYDMGLGLAAVGNVAPREIWPYYPASTTAATAATTTTTDYLGVCGGGGDAGAMGGGGVNIWSESEIGSVGSCYVDPEGLAWPSFVIPGRRVG